MNNEAKDIMEDIYSDLDGDNETNYDMLQIKKNKYSKHPRYKNILDKILIKEKEYLSKENLEAYNKMMDTYVESIDYGISLAKEYFEENKIEETKKILETLIKSFSDSYINDEYGNCLYFANDLEKELYSYINKDERRVYISKVNKGYVYYMYGRILLESQKYKEAMLSFELAYTYSPFLKEAYFFKALLLKVLQRFNESKEELLKAHKYLYKTIDLADFYYFVGNYCYKFINKDYEYVMYQKSYLLNPDVNLFNEIKEMKPIDRDLEFDSDLFETVAKKENIPLDFNLDTKRAIETITKDNEELLKYVND